MANTRNEIGTGVRTTYYVRQTPTGLHEVANLNKTLGLLSCCLSFACSSSTGNSWSQVPDPSIDIRGHYEWFDAHGLSTGCLVRIFIQDERYRGWVIDDQYQERVCRWRGFELSRFEGRGFEFRVSIGCPRAGCPGNTSSFGLRHSAF